MLYSKSYKKNNLFVFTTFYFLLQLLLHNPADLPIGIQPTAYVTRNNMLSISLTITLVRSSPKIKKWPSTIRNCYFQHERQLKFFKIYTNQNCEIECKANNTLNKCGCNAFYQPSENLVFDYYTLLDCESLRNIYILKYIYILF